MFLNNDYVTMITDTMRMSEYVFDVTDVLQSAYNSSQQ